MLKYVSGKILKSLGWKIKGEYPFEEKKLVIIVFHHTSYWDFPTGLLLRKALGFKSNFVMKGSFFKPPFGFIFKWLGGYPVERDPKKKTFSMTESISNLYKENDQLSITFTPEGTRSKVRTLKTGSWLIAKKAEVPILFIDFDFGRKVFTFSKAHKACDSFKEEYELMKKFFGKSKGFNPELSFDFNNNDMTFKKE